MVKQTSPDGASGDESDERAVDRVVGRVIDALPAPVRSAVGGMLRASIIGLVAGFLLLFGGVLLGIAWQTSVQPVLDARHYAAFTGKVDGRIVDSWMAVEFDPDDMRKGSLRWVGWSRIAPCAVVEYAGEWGAPLRRAFCGGRFESRAEFNLDTWDTLTPGVPFAFARDTGGIALQEIRLSKVARDWLDAHPPYDRTPSKPPPATALAALREQYDRPIDVAVASWSRPFPAFPLAFEPAHPDQALPAAYVDQRRDAFWWGSIAFAVIFAAMGLPAWRVGVGFVLDGQRRSVQWLLTFALLLVLPWWNDVLPRLLARVDRDWAQVAQGIIADMTRTTRLVATAPAEATLIDGERIVWNVREGVYADTFGRVPFQVPEPPPASPDEALEALRLQAAGHVARLGGPDRARLFARLKQDHDNGRDAAGAAFTRAAEQTLRDADAGLAAHRAARDFLIVAGNGRYSEDELDKIEVPPRGS